MNKLAIFVSGSGTNMDNILKHIEEGKLDAEVKLVVCDKPGAGAIEKAKRYGVEVALFNRKDYESKEGFEAAIIDRVDAAGVDWLVLAGYMKILSSEFVNHYWGKIINVHPSLLPKHPGAHGIKDTFEAGESEAGATTHFVTPEVDAGPIIMQKSFPITPDDTLESVEEKVHGIEYEIYPETLKQVISGQAQPPIRKI